MEDGKICTEDLWEVWIDEKQRIASFHALDGYIKYVFRGRELFRDFMHTLQKSGYRFQ